MLLLTKFTQANIKQPVSISSNVSANSDSFVTVFKRKGSNIEYTVMVTSKEAESGVELEIPSLEGDGKWFTKTQFKGSIGSGMLKSLPNKGLPKVNEEGCRGTFYIRFEVLDNSFKGWYN